MDSVIAPDGAETGLLGAGAGAGAGAGFVGAGVGWLEVVPEFEEPLLGAELLGPLGEDALDEEVGLEEELVLEDEVLWVPDAVATFCFRPLQPASIKTVKTRGTQ